jgi:DNA helicase HerA-like ATPase
VLGQLGNRVQHALRAFTPRDQKAVKSAATTLRANPKLKVEKAITELEVGEALVSFLDDKGRPTVVERAYVVPPGTRLGPVTAAERKQLMQSSAVAGTYEKAVDRESAYEKLARHVEERAEKAEEQQPAGKKAPAPAKSEERSTLGTILGGSTGPRGGRREGALEAGAKSAARSIGSAIGREIVRGVLGSIFGGTTTRRRR